LLFIISRRLPRATLFPYTTLFRSALHVQKISKNTWRVFEPSDKVAVSYLVYGFEVSVRTSFIDDSRAFLSPVGTFMYVDGQLDRSEEHTSELQSRENLVCRLLLEK